MAGDSVEDDARAYSDLALSPAVAIEPRANHYQENLTSQVAIQPPMSYECDHCGASFETLSRFRLHECSPEPADDTPVDSSSPADSAPDSVAVETEYPALVGDLPDIIEEAKEGDLSALYRAIAEYETALTKTSIQTESRSDDAHHDILFAYYEPLAEGLDTAAQANGWDVLVEFVDAYDPREQDGLPEVAHVIANAVGRSLVRTRLSEGLDSVPAEALAYLGEIPEYVDEFAVAFEESYTYGWGIGHPAHSVGDQLRALADTEHKWTSITLKTAFYADQHTAIDVFEELVTSETLTGTIERMTFEVGAARYYFGAVADLERDFLNPHVPMYWEWEEEIDYSFMLDPDVKQRIRQLAHETGVTDDLPADWTLPDLDPSPLSEFEEELFANEER